VDERRRAKTIEDDRDVALSHVVYTHQGFEESARALFTLVRRAQSVKPGKRRRLFLDIEGQQDGEIPDELIIQDRPSGSP